MAKHRNPFKIKNGKVYCDDELLKNADAKTFQYLGGIFMAYPSHIQLSKLKRQ